MTNRTLNRRQALAAGGVLASASLGLTKHAKAAAPSVIKIAGGASFYQGKLRLSGYAHVVDQQGWLKQQLQARGIDLQWYTTSHAATGPMINEAFASGEIQFAGYGDLPSAILNASGVETRLIQPHGLGQSESFLVVPADSQVKTIEDLKGKTIAVHRGRPWELPLLRLLASKGLSYSDFRIFNINPQAGMAALAANRVDALVTMTDAYLLEDKKVGRIVWSTKEAPVAWKMRTELWASKAFVEQHADLAQLVVTANVKAAHWASLDQNREALVKIGAAGGIPESVVRRSQDDHRFAWKDRWSPLFNEVVYKHYEDTLALSLQQKLIRKPLDLKTWFEPRFVKQALAELKLQDHWQPVKVG